MRNNPPALFLSLILTFPLILVAGLSTLLARTQAHRAVGLAAPPAGAAAGEPEGITYTLFLPLVSQAQILIPPDDPVVEEATASMINQQRADNGLYPLALVPELTQAARRHSNDMADNGFTGHTGSDGSDAGRRMAEAGYDWVAWGEIIAWGFGGDPASVVAWWMNSPPHRSLILSAYLVDFGVGYARDPDSQWGHYWTVNFGRPAPALNLQPEDQPVHCTFTSTGPAGGSSVQLGIFQRAVYHCDW